MLLLYAVKALLSTFTPVSTLATGQYQMSRALTLKPSSLSLNLSFKIYVLCDLEQAPAPLCSQCPCLWSGGDGCALPGRVAQEI